MISIKARFLLVEVELGNWNLGNLVENTSFRSLGSKKERDETAVEKEDT